MKTGSAGCEKRRSLSSSDKQVSGRQRPGSFWVHHMSTAGSAAVPVVQFFQIHVEGPEHSQNAFIVVMGRPVKRATGVVAHIHFKNSLLRLVQGIVRGASTEV